MSSTHMYSLRVVIHRLDGKRCPVWRIVAYVGRQVIGGADFSSAGSLLRAFESANPDFDCAALSHSLENPGSPIVFAAEMDLSYYQLCILGMAESPSTQVSDTTLRRDLSGF